MSTKEERFRRAKVYLIVALGIVFCVVGYFRLHKGGAKAGGRPGLSAPAVAPAARPAAPPPRQEAGAGLAPSGDIARDIFAPARSAAAEGAKEAKATAAREAMPVLTGVICSDRDRLAVINGQFQRVGSAVGPYTIVRIGTKEVTLKESDREMVLRIGEYEKK